MAGFVASAQAWSDFDIQWRDRLRLDNLSYFHMQRFAHATTHPKKPFDDSWIGKEERRRALLSDLLDIIQGRAYRKLGCILPLEAFLMLSNLSRKNFAPQQIVLTARLLWSELEVWRRREKYQNPCELVFEAGDLGKGELISAMEELTHQTPLFRHKIDDPERDLIAFTPLQASDLLAFEIQKMTTKDGRPDITFRFPYVQLEHIPGDIRMLQSNGADLIDDWARVSKYFDDNPLNGRIVN